MISEVLENHDQLFRDILQGNLACLDFLNSIRQVVKECIVQFVALVVEVPVVICSNVGDAAGGNVKKVYGEVEEILGDILRGVIPDKHLLGNVLQHVFEMCSELGHVHSTQCCVESDVRQFGWNIEGEII